MKIASLPLVALLLLTGCLNVATFDYSASSGNIVRFEPTPGWRPSLAVMPFNDARPFGTGGAQGTGMIPLVPVASISKQQPEISDQFITLGRFHFSPQNDLSEAAYLSLKNANIFAKVMRANNLEQAKEADYLWRGTVTNSEYRGGHLTYCITYIAAPVFWLLGAPNGVSHNRLALEFELINRRTGEKVWSYSFDEEDYITHWLYVNNGKDVSLYPQLMKKAMNQAAADLHAKLPEILTE